MPLRWAVGFLRAVGEPQWAGVGPEAPGPLEPEELGLLGQEPGRARALGLHFLALGY
jgi:hypothetical protein